MDSKVKKVKVFTYCTREGKRIIKEIKSNHPDFEMVLRDDQGCVLSFGGYAFDKRYYAYYPEIDFVIPTKKNPYEERMFYIKEEVAIDMWAVDEFFEPEGKIKSLWIDESFEPEGNGSC